MEALVMLRRNAFTHQKLKKSCILTIHQDQGLSGIQGSLTIQYGHAKGYTRCLDLEQTIPR